MPLLLVIDDNQTFLDEFVSSQSGSFEIHTSTDSEKYYLNPELCVCYDAVLIDVRMPMIDGLNLCLALKRRIATPIFLLTNDQTETTVLTALKMKVEDFLTKAMSAAEIRLRILNRLSRRILRLKSLVFNLESGRVEISNKAVDLTPLELSILRCILESTDCQVSRARLNEVVWKGRQVVSHTLNSHIYNLNCKIESWEYAVKIEKSGDVVLKSRIGDQTLPILQQL